MNRITERMISAAGRRRSSNALCQGGGLLLALLLVGAYAASADAQGDVQRSERHEFRVVTVVQGLQHPWGMAFLPGGDILVTERPGQLRVVRNGTLVPQPVRGVPEVVARGQGGLMDVTLHPNFAQNRLVYLSYSKPGPEGATTAVIRGRFENDRLTGVQEVIETQAWGRGVAHFGSRLVFDRDGYLYITIGDRGDNPHRGAEQRAQNLRDHAGTTLRIHDDGRIPQDNPFVGRNNALPEIFTYGNRNAQGMAVHPATGQIWQTEHGPRGGDELNLIRAGRNYGWPVVTRGTNYDGRQISARAQAQGIEPAVHHWTPSIATAGMTIYDGNAFPNWRGNFFVGALAGQHLARLTMDGTRVVGEEKLLEGRGRIRDVQTGPDGFLYLLLDAPNAPLLRLEPVRR